MARGTLSGLCFPPTQPDGLLGLLQGLLCDSRSSPCRAVCDERWHNITRNLRLRGAMTLANQDFLQRQPTWCTLQPDKFESLAQRGHQRYPENVSWP